MSFVGVRDGVKAAELQELAQEIVTAEHGIAFLRWPHRVSGFVSELPSEFPSPEGQVFDGDRELRWRWERGSYSVLLLSASTAMPEFVRLPGDWDSKVRGAAVYPETETRLPQGVKTAGRDISQRYFIDRRTETVHFVALVAGGGRG